MNRVTNTGRMKRSKDPSAVGMVACNCARCEGPNRDRAMCGKTSGNASARTIGNVSIAPGTNAAAITDTEFPTIAFALILAGDTGFASTTYQSWWSKVPHVSNSEASGLEWLTRAQKPGRPFGTEPTMSMWTMSMTGITCSTDNIPELQSQSTFRCSQRAPRRQGFATKVEPAFGMSGFLKIVG